MDRLAAIVIVGISSRLPFDDSYRDFCELLASHIGTSIASVRAYEEERRKAEALAELDRAKTAFFSNVSHEFRTPLTLMLGPLEATIARSGDALSPVDSENLRLVHKNSLRLLKLVNALLDFSRIEAGRAQATYEPIELGSYTTDLASMFRSVVEKASLEFTVDCQPLSRPVYVDREMWEKIVLNLLSNAFKFTPAGGITVSIQEFDDEARLTVRDTGTGIAPEEQKQVFNRFHRVRGASGRTFEGTGIGLSLVKELVKLHGGDVRVESELGAGSAFIVTIPFGSEHLPSEQVSALVNEPAVSDGVSHVDAYVAEALDWISDSPLSLDSDDEFELTEMDQSVPRARIILADDNADMREYIRRILSERYEVEAAADGLEAFAAALANAPDLVISDVMMPNMDGIELLHAMRGDPRTRAVPVILLSARAGEESKIEGLETGADDYLIKPFSPRELVARIGVHLQLSSKRKEAARQELLISELQTHQVEIEALNARLKRGMRETHHRVKNNLQIISAMVEMLGMDYKEAKAVPLEDLKQISTHIRTLAIVHDFLTKRVRENEQEQRISAKGVLETLIPLLGQTMGGQEIRYHIEEAELLSKQCISLAIVMNELVSNALKHGRGVIDVAFTVRNHHGILEVKDNGRGFSEGVDPIKNANTGMDLVQVIVGLDLEGDVRFENNAEGGACVRVTFSLPDAVQEI